MGAKLVVSGAQSCFTSETKPRSEIGWRANSHLCPRDEQHSFIIILIGYIYSSIYKIKKDKTIIWNMWQVIMSRMLTSWIEFIKQ